MPRPFDHDTFRATIFAAFVTQDWDAVGNALAILQDVTGTTVVDGDPSPQQVMAWAQRMVAQLAQDAAYLEAHGEAHPRLQCHTPDCTTHGNAVRARIARQHAQALAEAAAQAETQPAPEAPSEGPSEQPRGRVLIWGPPIPGEQ